MSTDLFSPANESEREAFALMKRAFCNGASLAAVCRAAAAFIESESVNVSALAASGEALNLSHVTCLCFTRSTERAALMVAWLRDAARRLDTLPASADDLAKIIGADGETFAAFERNLFGEDAK